MKKIIIAFVLYITIIGTSFAQGNQRNNGANLYTFFVNVVNEQFWLPLIGFVNIAGGSHDTPQIGFVNWNQGNFSSLQLGFINTVGGNTGGLQMGFINTAVNGINGVQLGFINYADSIEQGIPVGFLSIVGMENGQWGITRATPKPPQHCPFSIINLRSA